MSLVRILENIQVMRSECKDPGVRAWCVRSSMEARVALSVADGVV